MDASDLDMELVSDGLEFWHLNAELWKGDMNRSSQGSSEVCGAGGDVAKAFIVSESSHLFNFTCGSGKS